MADDASNEKACNLSAGGNDVKPKSENVQASPANEVDPLLQQLYKADNNTVNTAKEKSSDKPSKPDDVMKTAKSASLKTSEGISSKKSRKPPSSVKRNRPTLLTFHQSSKRNDTAYCMLVLCNVSDVPLHFTLKGCKDSNVNATFGDGLISPHAQLRTLLTMDRPKTCSDWIDAPKSRILLATRFLDAQNEQEITHTRLLGSVSRTKTCTVSTPPVEQLLLDAMGNLTQHNTPTTENTDRNHTGNSLADLMNKLSDNSILLLLILLAVIFVLFGSGGHR